MEESLSAIDPRWFELPSTVNDEAFLETLLDLLQMRGADAAHALFRLFTWRDHAAGIVFWTFEHNRLLRAEPLSPVALLILTSWYFELEREILHEER